MLRLGFEPNFKLSLLVAIAATQAKPSLSDYSHDVLFEQIVARS